MDWQFLVSLVGLSVLVASGFWLVPRLWRDPDFCYVLGVFFSRVGGEAIGQGMARSGPLTWVALAFFTASGWVMLFSEQSSATPPAIVLLIAAGIAYALDWIIVFFNRPRFLVPPHARDEKGAIHALRLPFWPRRNHQQRDGRGADVDLRSG